MRKPRSVSAATMAKIDALWESGVTVTADIAAQAGCSVAHVQIALSSTDRRGTRRANPMPESWRRVQRLHAEGMDNMTEMAKIVGISDRQVSRILLKLGLREPAPVSRRIPQPVKRRAAVLLSEGMPATWAYDEVKDDMGYDALLKLAHKLPNHKENTREWSRVWQSIAIKPDLLELHYQIAPPSMDQIKTMRSISRDGSSGA